MWKHRIEVKTFHGKTETIYKDKVDYVLFYKPNVNRDDEEFIWLKTGSYSVKPVTIPLRQKGSLQKG